MTSLKTIFYLTYFSGVFWHNNNVQSFSPDYYGGGLDGMEDDSIPPAGGPEYLDSLRDKRTRDVLEAKDSLGNEVYSGNKRFKLYEKKNLNYDKAKAFCKKREGKLAQAMNVEEMSRLQSLIMKAKAVSTGLWIDADKREWKKHSSKMLGMQPNLGPNAHMIRGGGPTAMCPTLSLSTRSLTPNPCHQSLPFICEYGEGKGPKKKNAGNMTEKKRKRSEEMKRKKREIVELGDSESDTNFSSSSQSPLEMDTTESPEERFFPESEIILDDNDQLVLDEFIPPNQHEEFNDSVAAHSVGFKPHVIASNSEESSASPSPSPYPYPSITTIFNHPGEIPSPRMFVKVSANYTVQDPILPSLEIGQDFGVVERVDNELEIGHGTLPHATEKHPDQQMVDLFDEQIETMKISDLLESPSPENVTSTSTTGMPLPTVDQPSGLSENIANTTSMLNENFTDEIDMNSIFDESITIIPESTEIENLNSTGVDEVYQVQDQKLGNFTEQTEIFTNFTSNSENVTSSEPLDTNYTESGNISISFSEGKDDANSTNWSNSSRSDQIDSEAETEESGTIQYEMSENAILPMPTATKPASPPRKRLLVPVTGDEADPEPESSRSVSKSQEIHIDELPLLNKLVAG